MTVQVAFYKGRGGWDDRIIRFITRSPYSHCELAIPQADGTHYCVSSHIKDGGVRGRTMRLSPDQWDILPCDVTEDAARQLLAAEQGCGYDYLGVLRFVLPFMRQSKRRWFCSELVGTALGMTKPHKQTPGDVYNYLRPK